MKQLLQRLTYLWPAFWFFLVIGVFFSLLSMWMDPVKALPDKLGGSAMLFLIGAFFLGLLSVLNPRR